MKSRETYDASAGDARPQLVDRRDIVMTAFGVAGALAAAAIAPSGAAGVDGDLVRVGQVAIGDSGYPVFWGKNTGTGEGVVVESAKHDAIHATSGGTGRSGLYAVGLGDGWGVYAEGRRAGVLGLSSVGPGVKGDGVTAGVYAVSSKGDGVSAEASASGKSAVNGAHSGDGWGVYGVGNRSGVYGESTAGPGVTARGASHGVLATSTKGDGVRAETSAPGKSGVYAYNDAADYGYGVFARSKYTGVHGESPRFGVSGVGAGTTGEAIGCAGFGDKTGVLGAARQVSAVGVHAVNGYGGTALRVDGPVTFKRSGLATTSIGARYKAVGVPGGLVPGSKYLVTMQGSPGSGVFITYARYQSATAFRVYFNKACTVAATFAWMVLD